MKEKIQKFSKFFILILTRFVLVAIILFILANIGKSIWKNYETNKQIEAINGEIFDAKKDNQNLKNLIAYYQTDSFKELELRKKLNYKKPGENVFIIPEITSTENPSLPQEKTKENSSKTGEEPNFIKWYKYIIRK